MCSFQVDEWSQGEKRDGGTMYRGRKSCAPQGALLPALRCLAFLLMASSGSQLPNAFPQCGDRMYSVFSSREFSRAVFLCCYEGSLLLEAMAGKRQCLLGRNV